MPIFEYRCGGCGQEFETLVRTGDTPACPSCGSVKLEKLVSMFAVDSEGTRESSLAGARKKHAARERDRVTAEFEQHHKHDHD